MKFYQRFAYYFIGFTIGMFVVALVWNRKDVQFNYLPNARVLSNISSKPMFYDSLVIKQFNEKWVDTSDIRNTLIYGDVDFSKSNSKEKGGKLYTIYGKTKQNLDIILEIINYEDKAVLRNISKRKSE
ncbi:MAG: DUF4258 domain-containing protein [Flavobacterium sp.]|jgi:hypothetical protein|uniref:DUF4258 domain-containing protein n=1 Tax=Flavobacterium sp. TaxID=239 RepID=UPI003BCB8024